MATKTDDVRRLLLARAAAALEAGVGGGTLLYGPPGCGKTMLARALGLELAVHTEWLPPTASSHAELAAALQAARAAAPCVLVMDELQSLAPAAVAAGSTEERTALQLADGVQALRGARVFVLGVCRAPHDVHVALRRGGRLHHQLAIHAPDPTERYAILLQHAAGMLRRGAAAGAAVI